MEKKLRATRKRPDVKETKGELLAVVKVLVSVARWVWVSFPRCTANPLQLIQPPNQAWNTTRPCFWSCFPCLACCVYLISSLFTKYGVWKAKLWGKVGVCQVSRTWWQKSLALAVTGLMFSTGRRFFTTKTLLAGEQLWKQLPSCSSRQRAACWSCHRSAASFHMAKCTLLSCSGF